MSNISARAKVKKTFNVSEKTGWANLFKLLWILFVLRFILLNLREFGFIMQVPLSGITFSDCKSFSIALLVNLLRYPLCYLFCNYKIVAFLFCICLGECLVAFITYNGISNLYLSCFSYTLSLICVMKLFSFLVNGKKTSFSTFLEFCTFPTLVFKETYKRKTSVNKKLVFVSVLKMLVFVFLFCFFMDQHAVPAVIQTFKAKSYYRVVEGFIHLSIASIFLFNLFFRISFVCAMGIVCEVTRFDECIFRDWWNAQCSADFWKDWNFPVHLFIKEHIYLPLIGHGCEKTSANLICFLYSAIIHEYAISMTLKSVNGWFFLAMVFQIPFHYLTKAMKDKVPAFANMFFWLCFCVLGQPLLTLLMCRATHLTERLFDEKAD